MHIHVQKFDGTRIILEVEASDTTEDVKLKIQDKTNIPPNEQRLIVCGRELQAGRTLRDHNLSKVTTIFLLKAMKGGCFLPDTLVLRADHTRQTISSINPGDQVLAFTSSGEIVSTTVKQVFVRQVDSYVDLDVGEENTTLQVTRDHLCYAGDGEFKTLEQLLSDNYLFMYTSDPENTLKPTIINRNTIITKAGTEVYNLHTSYPHTFFANGVAVHNMSGDDLGMDFVDVSNDKGLKRVEWSQNAPRWRQASPGICLEGKCTKKSCPAFNQQVIINIGLKVFDVLTGADANTSKCPACGQYVEPTSCAFNRCMWRWSGIKSPGHGLPPVEATEEWRRAGNAYHYFDKEVSGQVKWRKLILEAKAD